MRILKKNKILDFISGSWMILASVLVFLIPAILLVALIAKSEIILADNNIFNLITGNEWRPLSGTYGFAPFIISSLYVTLLSIVISLPLCLMASLYVTHYTGKRFLRFVQPVMDILGGIPSVVYGVWGIIAIVPAVRNIANLMGYDSSGYSLLSASIVLAVMIIPFIMNMMIEILKTIPDGLNEAALSLGATQWQSLKLVIIKKAMPGLISAVFMGLARAFGETMAVLMVAGSLLQIPDSLFSGAYPLPALIANNYGEMQSIPGYESALMFAALILLVIVLFFNILSRIAIRYYSKHSA